MKTTVNIVCALKCEAEPLIRHYEMQSYGGGGRFPFYQGEGVRLVLTGVGKKNAEEGTRYLKAEAGGEASALWLNVGIAGHPKLPLGWAVIAHKIRDGLRGQSWYPHLAFNPPVPTESLITVSQPAGFSGDDQPPALYDMEAAGYYPAALEGSTTELVHCLKIVSDNIENPTKTIIPINVRKWVIAALPVIDRTIQRIRDLADARLPATFQSDLLADILERWHFTAYQKNETRKLWRRMRSLNRNQDFTLELDLSRFRNSGEFVFHLKALVQAAPVPIGPLKS